VSLENPNAFLGSLFTHTHIVVAQRHLCVVWPGDSCWIQGAGVLSWTMSWDMDVLHLTS